MSESASCRVTVDGIEYRVFDTPMRAEMTISANPPVAWAASRVFRPKEGYRRRYRLREPAAPRIDLGTLERRLRQAEYLPRVPVGSVDQDPR